MAELLNIRFSFSCRTSHNNSDVRNGMVKSDSFYKLRISSKPVFKEIFSQEEIDKIVTLQLDIQFCFG